MTDTLTPTERSERMRRIRAKDTKPELLVRRLVHGMGYRYRLHTKDLPGTPDIAFRNRQKAIFVHGCFWHQHPSPHCKMARMPKSRRDFWEHKLQGNRARDERILKQYEEMGWKVLIVWECLTKNEEELKENIRAFMEDG